MKHSSRRLHGMRAIVLGSGVETKGDHVIGTAGLAGINALRDTVGGQSLEINSQVPTAERGFWQGQRDGHSKLGDRETSEGCF